MRFDGFAPPRIDPRHSRQTALEDPRFITAVMALWDNGRDTSEIAKATFEHEYIIAFCVRIGRERRRGQEAWPRNVAAGA